MVRRLILRCPQCRSTTSVQAEWAGGKSAEVACSNCNAMFELAPDRNRGWSDQDYYDRAKKFASENNIDLASGYSILEGILPRDRARVLPLSSPEIPRAASPPIRSLALLCAVLVGVGFLGNHLRVSWKQRSEPAQATRTAENRRPEKVAPPPAPFPVVCQVDAQEKLTKVEGPDPRSVLVAFCGHRNNAESLTAYALAPATPPSPWLRVGVVKSQPSGSLDSVEIRLDPRSSRWTIGTGDGPVILEPMQSLPEGADTGF